MYGILKIVLPGLVALLMVTQLLRDWRFHDRRTRRHRRITTLILILCLVLAGFSSWDAWQSSQEQNQLKQQITDLHSEATKQPSFRLFLNEKILVDGSSIVEIPGKDDAIPLVFTVRNEGSATAHNVQANLWTPSTVGRLKLAQHWTDQGSAIRYINGGYEAVKDVQQFGFVSPVPIHPDNQLTLGSSMKLIRSIDHPTEIKMRISVKADEGISKSCEFVLWLIPEEQ